MVSTLNPIPAQSEEYLGLMEKLKYDLRNLKKEAYGEDCNDYYNNRPRLLMKKSHLENSIHDIITNENLETIKKEQKEMKPHLEDMLIKFAIEYAFPQWFSGVDTLKYLIHIEGRNLREMRKGRDGGWKSDQKEICKLSVDEWCKSWGEKLYRDEMFERGDINKLIPKGPDYLISMVHRFIPVKNGQLQCDMRVKSGTEKLWKFITYLTGLEEKLSYTRETIEDELGVRFICGHNDFERKIINLHLNIVKDYKGVDWENSIILQVRDKDLAAQKKIFLDKVPPYLRSFYERIVSEEDRSRIELDNENLPKYYIEMRIPISTKVNGGNIFYRNQINILSYQWNHYKAIIKNYDSFTYKRRSEDWRDEHYTLFEWLVAREITPAILVGNSLEYANKTIDLRIKPYLKKHR